jgi:hypothetical protein
MPVMSAALAKAGSNSIGIANRSFLSIIGNPDAESAVVLIVLKV